jgi:hypothetical protein
MTDDGVMSALADGGMLPAQDEDRFAEADMLLMGRPDAVKFDEPADMVSGTIVEIGSQQAKKFGTDELLWWDDGRPKMDPVYVLRTHEGLRTLYVGSYRMRNAIRDAVLAAGFERNQSIPGVRPGGTLVVRFTGLGEAVKGAQPPKLYEAAYDPPGRRPLLPAPDAQPAVEAAGADEGPPF